MNYATLKPIKPAIVRGVKPPGVEERAWRDFLYACSIVKENPEASCIIVHWIARSSDANRNITSTREFIDWCKASNFYLM
jgi:hypothetical protein